MRLGQGVKTSSSETTEVEGASSPPIEQIGAIGNERSDSSTIVDFKLDAIETVLAANHFHHPYQSQPLSNGPTRSTSIEGLLPELLSPRGAQIQAALEAGPAETVPHQHSTAFGRLERILINDIDAHDEVVTEITHAIREAKNEICAQFYILDPRSAAGQEFLTALAETQAKNPDLKIFLAVNTIFGQGTRLERELKRLGIAADLSLHTVLPTRGALHSKLVVIDGNRAFIGGNNIDNKSESDTTVLLRGSVVDNLLAEFDDAFHRGENRAVNKRSAPHDLLRSHADNPPNVDREGREHLIQLLGKSANRELTPKLDTPANRAMIEAIDSAQSEIKLSSPNFNEISVWHRLADAAKRGVTINILLPRDYLNIASFIDAAPNRSLAILWDRLSPPERERVNIRWYSADGASHDHTHSKLLIIDDEWGYVGSQNFDRQAWGYSRELGVGVDDREAVRRLAHEAFDPDWDRAIPMRPGLTAKILLAPTDSFTHRCARYLLPPSPSLRDSTRR